MNYCLLKAKYLLVILSMDSQMESELESGPTEMFIKVNLLMVFSRVMVFFSVKMVNGHMKVNGRMVR